MSGDTPNIFFWDESSPAELAKNIFSFGQRHYRCPKSPILCSKMAFLGVSYVERRRTGPDQNFICLSLKEDCSHTLSKPMRGKVFSYTFQQYVWCLARASFNVQKCWFSAFLTLGNSCLRMMIYTLSLMPSSHENIRIPPLSAYKGLLFHRGIFTISLPELRILAPPII